ncbi:MAG: DNA-directed RNA polymerase subunit omega [Deferribacteraceae bacterium]|nr:DNA-directed RNA polymerase subunit omega [Deferribacteraceae bacterium]
MPFLDIERAIKESDIGSRFRLVHIASQRARELNSPTEDTVKPLVTEYNKVTTNALDEIIERKLIFIDEIAEPAPYEQ